MQKTKITVYISSHNYGKYLSDAIESVLRQTIDNWELFLINDNSSDNTQEIMNLYKGDPRIKLFTTNGIGLPNIANLALKNANREYLIRLDADDVFDENILLVLSNYLDRHPDVALVFPDYFLMDETGCIYAQERRQQVYYNNHMLDMPANGACTMVRKDILKKLGGYREDLGAQDGFDLWSRIIKKYKCANVNIPLFYYRRHGDNLTENFNRILSAKREIKKDACALDLDKYRPIIAVIPCRKNYDFCTDLWNQKIDGKTLLDTAIETCLKSSLLDKVVVASDNPHVKKTISKYNDLRLGYIKRDSEYTIRSRPIVYTLERTINELDIGWKGITVLSYIQAPFTTTETIEEAVYTLVMNDADCSIAVEEINEPLFKRTPHGLVQINSKGILTSDFDIIYGETRTCMVTRNINLKKGSLTGSKIVNFVVSKEEKFFIHTKRDLNIARLLKK